MFTLPDPSMVAILELYPLKIFKKEESGCSPQPFLRIMEEESMPRRHWKCFKALSNRNDGQRVTSTR